MRAGSLRWKVTFLKPVITINDYGTEKQSWEEAFTTKADVKFDSGDRIVENQELVFTNIVTFIVRFYHQIDEMMRIQWQGKTYRILSINPELLPYNQKIIKTELVNE